MGTDPLLEEVEILPRDHVERIARIVGPTSAAAQALECADSGEHGDEPVFCRSVRVRHHIMVTSAENLEAR